MSCFIIFPSGGIHYPVEGFTSDRVQRLRIEFFSPGDFRLDVKMFREPNISTAYLANVVVDKNNLSICVFFHAVRKIEVGVEYRSRYWLGFIMKNGIPVRKNRLMPKRVMMHMARNNCIHSLIEYNNLASFLPQLYNKMNGKIDN
ncbi:MAG: DAPG hydrolase family protein [Promethearchaeota archaeon]